MEPWLAPDDRSALLVSEPDWLRREQAMKTAGRENPNRWTTMSSNRVCGAAGQKKLCSITWAEKQEKLQPLEKCFFLTSPFMELPCCS
jgi:hypothetical protein